MAVLAKLGTGLFGGGGVTGVTSPAHPSGHPGGPISGAIPVGVFSVRGTAQGPVARPEPIISHPAFNGPARVVPSRFHQPTPVKIPRSTHPPVNGSPVRAVGLDF